LAGAVEPPEATEAVPERAECSGEAFTGPAVGLACVAPVVDDPAGPGAGPAMPTLLNPVSGLESPEAGGSADLGAVAAPTIVALARVVAPVAVEPIGRDGRGVAAALLAPVGCCG
jgi:hypothetical protein